MGTFDCTSCFFTVVIKHNVLRLQVSIDDAFLVQVTKCHRDLCQVETNDKNKNKRTRGRSANFNCASPMMCLEMSYTPNIPQ